MTKTNIDLKSCPFCGGDAKIGSLGGDQENWAIWCTDCDESGAYTCYNRPCKQDMINRWNTRAPTQASGANIDIVREALDWMTATIGVSYLNVKQRETIEQAHKKIKASPQALDSLIDRDAALEMLEGMKLDTMGYPVGVKIKIHNTALDAVKEKIRGM